VAAFTVLVGYIGFQAVLLQRATEIGKTYVAEHQLSQARAHALPQPFSPFHWMVVIEQDEAYAYAYVNLARNERVPTPPDDAFWLKRVYASYQGAQHARWQRVSRVGEDETQRALVQSAWNAPALLPYRQFTLFAVPYRVDRTNPKTCVWFQDLRFALVGRDMPFRYGACRESERAPWAVYRVVDDVDGKEISEAVL
jgi:inner membrane protein